MGRFITSNLGKWLMNIVRTQGAIVWVCGDRKWMFRTMTVTHMLKQKTTSGIRRDNSNGGVVVAECGCQECFYGWERSFANKFWWLWRDFALGMCEAAGLKTVNGHESLPTNFDHKSIQFLQIISETVNKASRWPHRGKDNLACAYLNFPSSRAVFESVSKQSRLANNLITMKFGSEMRIFQKRRRKILISERKAHFNPKIHGNIFFDPFSCEKPICFGN